MNIRVFILCVLTLAVSSCNRNIDVNKPVKLVWDKGETKSENVIVFLPGLYDSADIFVEKSFFTMARKEGIKADMVAASIDVEHLLQNKMLLRIKRDIIAQVKAYKNIWFVGVSLGGLNSLLFYKNNEEAICGLVILAPYLGNDDLTEELKTAGKIKNWRPRFDKNKEAIDNRIDRLWLWFKTQSTKGQLDNIYLGYGRKDKYVESIKILETLLPDKNITVVEGKHNWEAGQKIWQQQLVSREQTGLLKPCH